VGAVAYTAIVLKLEQQQQQQLQQARTTV